MQTIAGNEEVAEVREAAMAAGLRIHSVMNIGPLAGFRCRARTRMS